jgi:hypothetical protein
VVKKLYEQGLRVACLDASPNPFNPDIKIQVSGWRVGCELRILDVTGRLVADLTTSLNIGYRGVGLRQIAWNASKHPAGVFFVALRNGVLESKRRIVLLR